MKSRTLGTSGLQVSILGMGCWQYGGGSYWGDQSQKDVDEVVHRSLDFGINYFDTAEVYNDGASEISLGLALKGRRDKAIIGSKVTTANAAPRLLRKSCEASLKRLQTEYIDLYMLHWPISPLAIKHFTSESQLIENPPSVEAVFTELQVLQKEGKIRHIGLSNHGVKQMQEVHAAGVHVAVNELAYNLFSRAIEAEILHYCVDNHIGVIGYSPLLQGLLTGKFSALSAIKPMQARSRHYHHSRGAGTRHGEEGAEHEINTALKEIRTVVKELGVDMTTIALAWAVANEGISTTIVGCRNTTQLEHNVKGADFELSGDVIDRLNQITEPVLQKLGGCADYYENRHHSRVW